MNEKFELTLMRGCNCTTDAQAITGIRAPDVVSVAVSAAAIVGV